MASGQQFTVGRPQAFGTSNVGCGEFTNSDGRIQENTVRITANGQICNIEFSGTLRARPGDNRPFVGVPRSECADVPCPDSFDRRSVCIGREHNQAICNPPRNAPNPVQGERTSSCTKFENGVTTEVTVTSTPDGSGTCTVQNRRCTSRGREEPVCISTQGFGVDCSFQCTV